MSSGEYPVPQGPHRVEETIQRSRFITSVGHASTGDAAKAFVASVREEFPDATHHCWAFVAGPPGDTAQVGMSDDGEPHGTAGRPMLNVLLHSGFGEIVAVGTRYYGGTKLGTGGLSRAYSSGVTAVLKGLPTRRRVDRVVTDLVIDYEHVDSLQRLMESSDVEVHDVDFSTDVRYELGIPAPGYEAFAGAVQDLTGGQATLSPR